LNISITGGGTGGHLAIAKSLCEAAKKQNFKTIFIGSTSGQDRDYFENSDIFDKTYFLETSGVVNKKGLSKLSSLFNIFKSFLKARKILKQENVCAVYSVGGYSAAPASFAAISLRIPLFIHEQNAVTGKLNSILRPFAKEFISSYETSSPIKGYPTNEIFFSNQRIRKKIKTIIFLGGSQGALYINNLALNVAKELHEKGINIIHQCGKKDYDRVKKEYEKLGIDVELYGFTKELDKLIQKADFAVSRSGASTLWELCASGLPALFIPYPYAASNHQYYNAKFLQDQNLCYIATQEENPKELLLSILNEDLEQKSKKLIEITQKGVADLMIQRVKELC